VTPHEIYLVVNAGCRDKDLEHIGKHLQAAKVCTHVLSLRAWKAPADVHSKVL
jgi:glycine cleavage system aminomethyltransferase T